MRTFTCRSTFLYALSPFFLWSSMYTMSLAVQSLIKNPRYCRFPMSLLVCLWKKCAFSHLPNCCSPFFFLLSWPLYCIYSSFLSLFLPVSLLSHNIALEWSPFSFFAFICFLPFFRPPSLFLFSFLFSFVPLYVFLSSSYPNYVLFRAQYNALHFYCGFSHTEIFSFPAPVFLTSCLLYAIFIYLLSPCL